MSRQSRLVLSLLLVCVSCVVGSPSSVPFQWRAHRMCQQGDMTISSLMLPSPSSSPSPSPSPSPSWSPSLNMTCSVESMSNATILSNLACFPNLTIADYLLHNWEALSSLRTLLNKTSTDTTSNATLFVPTNAAIQQALAVGMTVFGIKLGLGEGEHPVPSSQTKPATESLLKALQMKTRNMKSNQQSVFEFPPASVYYNLSYPFPPPPVLVNLTLTPQQVLMLLTHLPHPLQDLFAEVVAYHVVPGHVLARNNTCFMQAVETAMEGERVEQVPGAQLLLLQNYRNGMNATEYLAYLEARHTIVQGPFNATLPPFDLRVVSGSHASPYIVDPIGVDLPSSNGVFHVIDRVIMIPPSVAGYLAIMNRTTSHMSTALSRHPDLLNDMTRPNRTLFIPTNYAFERSGVDAVMMTASQWKQLIQQHVVKGVHVLIPDIGNTSFCHPTPLPLNLTTLSNHELVITHRHDMNHTFFVNGTNPLVDDNVLVSNGVVHLVDNLLVSPSFLAELRSTSQPQPLPTPSPTPVPAPVPVPVSPPVSCPNGAVCLIYQNITHRDQHVSVCFDPAFDVCINGTYLCPIDYPMTCVSPTSIDCYSPTSYACVPIEGKPGQHHLVQAPQAPQAPTQGPTPTPSPSPSPSPEPLTPPADAGIRIH